MISDTLKDEEEDENLLINKHSMSDEHLL